ncbi:MAG: hypothetical protein E7176_06475 [Erysipelotrichaceae bacterium]|nr:hypothetical protein [Erysipelotrichaceae bacterium]
MNIYFDTESSIYKEKNRKLKNCITINENNQTYYYEFNIANKKALITYNDDTYLDIAIDEYRKHNPIISIFYNKDNSFYKAFDEIPTYKLPISCIQPTKFFLSEEILNNLEEYIDEDDQIYIPVAIIDEEYVCIDGHHRLMYLNRNYEKLVNVYLYKYPSYLNDFIYLAKENNIKSISNVKILKDEEYKIHWNGFINDYFEYK